MNTPPNTTPKTTPARAAAPTLPRILIPLTIVFASLMIVSLFALRSRSNLGPGGSAQSPVVLGEGGSAVDQGPPPEALASLVIPEFTLTDQNGSPQTRDIFAGRWTILAFTFTNCPTACPIMNSNLLRLQEALKGTPARIVSISVDPKNDTPEALKLHAERIGADPQRWTFLTGDEQTMLAIVKGLKFALTDDPSIPITLPSGETMNNIVHPTNYIFVSPKVTVAGLESGVKYESVDRAAATLRRLMTTQPPTR